MTVNRLAAYSAVVALAFITGAAAAQVQPVQGTMADCAPSFLAMDPDGSGYFFSAVLKDAAGRPIWDRTWGFPTPARCREAREATWAVQRVLLIPTLTVTECR